MHGGSALLLLGLIFINSQVWTFVLAAYGAPTFLFATVVMPMAAFPAVSVAAGAHGGVDACFKRALVAVVGNLQSVDPAQPNILWRRSGGGKHCACGCWKHRESCSPCAVFTA